MKELISPVFVEPLLYQLPNDVHSILENCYVQVSDVYAHLPTIYMTIVDGKLKRILELGTGEAKITMVLLLAAKEIGGEVVSVDIPDSVHIENVKDKIEKSGLSNLCTLIYINDLNLFWNNSIDCLIMDTIHTFDHTLDELRKYEPYVEKGGVIVVHDTTSYNGVWNAIKYYFRDKNVKIKRWWHNNGLVIVTKL